MKPGRRVGVVVPVILRLAGGAIVLAHAQQAPPPQMVVNVTVPATKVEALLASKDTVLVKAFYDLGTVRSPSGGLSVEALVVTPLAHEDRRVKGLRIEVADASGSISRTSVSFLDIEELDRVSRALAAMSDLAAGWSGLDKTEYTEVGFSTAGDFHVGFSQRRLTQSAFVSSGTTDPVQARLDIGALAKVKAIVDEALTLLPGK